MFDNLFRGKRILITGHTGFKGSWLSLWLKELGAEVAGLSLPPPTSPSHFVLLKLENSLTGHFVCDIRQFDQVLAVFQKFQPEILFHLAAEPIVSTCFDQPLVALETNLMGTAHILEATRQTPSLRAAVIITSDKCYENQEWDFGYRETDQLGGKDPYSASKACAEIAFSCYFRSYLFQQKNLRIATARAGNVIGGGDWAPHRIIPDCVRAASKNEVALIRSPKATRPWQHVLEPLSGYLNLAADLLRDRPDLNGESFNFGPKTDVDCDVESLLRLMSQRWQKLQWKVDPAHRLSGHEAGLLKLNCDKSLRRLQWRAILSVEEAIADTADWYRQWDENPSKIANLSLQQIENYVLRAGQRGVRWAQNRQQ